MNGPLERLIDRLQEAGPLTFAEFMEEALYGVGGYYAGGSHPVSPGGDFITGSSHSPLFGQATATALLGLDAALSCVAELLEVGPGDGRHLEAVVRALEPLGGRRLMAWDRVARPLPDGVDRLAGGLDELAPRSLRGLVFSYEVFDALPIHRVIGCEAGLEELYVDLDADGSFGWRRGALSDPALAALLDEAGCDLEIDQIADLSLEWWPLYRRLAETLDSGLLVTVDYGYESRQLFDPRVRRHGTLACYRQHRVHRDPLRDVGRQDLTAHVDFGVLRRAGEAAGLETLAFTRQALWLTACGLFKALDEADLETRLEAQTLLAPDGMGSDLRVLVQGRGVAPTALPGFELLA